MKNFALIFGALILASSCASTQKNEMEQYMVTLSSKLDPIWKENMKDRVQKLASRGLKPLALSAPDNQILLSVSILKDGEVKDIHTIQKSKYAFLNQSAREVIVHASPLAIPPASCLRNDICELKWRFVIEP